MKCKHCSSLFYGYYEQSIDLNQMKEVEEHLQTCTSCSKDYALFYSAIRHLNPLTVIKAPPGFYERLAMRLPSGTQPVRVVTIVPAFVRWLRPVAIAAVLVTGVFIGLRVSDSLTRSGQQNASVGESSIVNSLAMEYMPEDAPEDIYSFYNAQQKN